MPGVDGATQATAEPVKAAASADSLTARRTKAQQLFRLPLLKLPLLFHDIWTRLGIFVEYRVGATARVFDLEFRTIQDGSPLCCCTCAPHIAPKFG